MKLNCKPGDLAVIVSARFPENIGILVSVLRQYIEGEHLPGDPFRMYEGPYGVSWVVESVGKPIRKWGEKGTYDLQTTVFADVCLRPIRDNDGEDETLQWVPRKVTA